MGYAASSKRPARRWFRGVGKSLLARPGIVRIYNVRGRTEPPETHPEIDSSPLQRVRKDAVIGMGNATPLRREHAPEVQGE